jgi:hypothetical protein
LQGDFLVNFRISRNNQADPALIEAEKNNMFIVNVRKHARFAALHLERLVALKLDKLEIPTFYCFQQTDSQVYICFINK